MAIHPNSRLIVTACDDGYFAFARQCVLSLVETVRDADLAVLDLGLEPCHREFFRAHGVLVRDPDGSVAPGASLRLHAAFSRPRLPELFPDHDHLMWIDADTVVFGGGALEDFFAASSGGALAVVPELHHAYHRYGSSEPRLNALHLRSEEHWLRGRQAWLRGPVSYEPFRALYGETVAESMAFRPLLNSGAFALRRDAPHWQLWADELAKAGSKIVRGFNDQPALNVAIVLHDLPVETLSATHNWLSSMSLPMVDTARGVLVTPSPEHEPIGIVHFAGLGSDRKIVLGTDVGGTFDAPLVHLRECLRALEPGE